jgi:hypothetical protein
MVSCTLGALVMAAVLTAYTFIGRNLARLSSYQALETESRKALTYLRRDFMQTMEVKSGTTPTGTNVTLVLPSGEVTYTYNSATKTLWRQSTFGANTNFSLLHNDSCECTTFQFRYFTANDEAPTGLTDVSATTNVPYSIKQIQVGFVIESPSTWTSQTRARYEIASSRYVFRNRGAPDGT